MVLNDVDSEVEVDILITIKSPARITRIGIECREYKRNQHAPWVHEVNSKYSVIPSIHQVVMVANKKFSQQAERLAKRFKIELRTLADVKAIDWSAFSDPMRHATPSFQTYNFDGPVDWLVEIPSGREKRDLSITDKVHSNDGKAPRTLSDFIDELTEPAQRALQREMASRSVEEIENEYGKIEGTLRGYEIELSDGERRNLLGFRMSINWSTKKHKMKMSHNHYGNTPVTIGSFEDDKYDARVVAIETEPGRVQLHFSHPYKNRGGKTEGNAKT